VQFKELLSANLNLNRYVRLMALASTDLLLTVLLASFVLYSNVAVTGLSPWISWAETHSNFSRVVQVPGIYWHADLYSGVSVETLRWATMVCTLLFFAYFEFADEAIKNYRGAFNSMARRVGYSTAGSSGLSLTGCVCIFLLSSFHFTLDRPSTAQHPNAPLLLFLARSYAPRLHPKRHHPKTRPVRLPPGHVCVLRQDLAARVRRR
jgi:hypothetical protein